MPGCNLQSGPDLADDARVIKEEIFGPCCHIRPFDTEEEVIALANDTPYGLAAAVWTENMSRALRVSTQIDCGVCWVNSWFLRDLRTPFGGSKESGIGREGGDTLPGVLHRIAEHLHKNLKLIGLEKNDEHIEPGSHSATGRAPGKR